MTKTETARFIQMWRALKRITQYQTVERLKKNSRGDWGLESGEALEMAYENVIDEARSGIKGIGSKTVMAMHGTLEEK